MPRSLKLSHEVKECILACKETARTCIAAIPHSVAVEGEHLSRPHVSLLNLCSDICQISARTLLAGVEFHESILRACASVCEACADECGSVNEDYMQKCAEVCRRCARTCRLVGQEWKMVA